MTILFFYNLDVKTRPDHVEDITEAHLIKRLGLEKQFDFVVFENIKPSFSINPQALSNAWDALRPEGKLILYPAAKGTSFLYDTVLSAMKFKDIHYYDGSQPFKDIFIQRIFENCPSVIAIKDSEEEVRD